MDKMSIFRVLLAEEVPPTAILVMENIFSANFANRDFSSHFALLVLHQIIIKVNISSHQWKLASIKAVKSTTVQLVAKNAALKFKSKIINQMKAVKKTVPTAKWIWNFITAKNVTSLIQRIQSVQIYHARFRIQLSHTQKKPKKRKKKKRGKSIWSSTKKWMKITERKNASHALMLIQLWWTWNAFMSDYANYASMNGIELKKRNPEIHLISPKISNSLA